MTPEEYDVLYWERKRIDAEDNERRAVHNLAVLKAIKVYEAKVMERKQARREMYLNMVKARKVESELGQRWKALIKRSARKGRLVSIGKERYRELINLPCYLCGHVPSDGKLNGVDRVDNTLGYTPENSRPACWPCNKFKGRFTLNEFIDVCGKVTKTQEKSKESSI